MTIDVIVLDGDQRSALAVTRSLGAKGKKIAVGSETDRSLASVCRHSIDRFSYPLPDRDPNGFIKRIREYSSNHPGAVLFPMTDVTLGEILQRRDELAGVGNIPFVDFDRYIAASDKANVLVLADDLGVPIPRTFFPTEILEKGMDRVVEECTQLGFPLVIKPTRSQIRQKDGWTRMSVRYAQDEQALRAALEAPVFRDQPFLIQERIDGLGVGIFLLMKDGNTIAKFAHKRIREKPPGGGVSVLSEGIEAPADALKGAERILQRLNWTGVAMVEFKGDRRDNRLKLMEINARFWGSLQLAILSGVDFPYLLFKMAMGEKIDGQCGYKSGIRLRWELGDLDHLLLRLTKSFSELCLPPFAPPMGKLLRQFMVDFVDPSTRPEVFRWRDSRPFLFELRQYVRALL